MFQLQQNLQLNGIQLDPCEDTSSKVTNYTQWRAVVAVYEIGIDLRGAVIEFARAYLDQLGVAGT
jgi:hypothetical protein